MNTYCLDWSAIATFIGTIVALFISNQWRKEKGSEVLSEISKQLYKQLSDYCKQQEKVNFLNKTYIFDNLLPNDDIRLPSEIMIISKNLDASHIEIMNSLNMINDYKKNDFLSNNINRLDKIYVEMNNTRETLYKTKIFSNELNEEQKTQNIYEIEGLEIEFNSISKKLKKYLVDLVFHKKN
jgi:hypothetical protein